MKLFLVVSIVLDMQGDGSAKEKNAVSVSNQYQMKRG